MGKTELWLTYQLASRAHLPPTTQLIELCHQSEKLADLEDVLEHVFRQGYVEARHRPKTWWEKKDGEKVKGSFSVEELLHMGVGKCEESALKLIVQDVPTHLWFQYVHATSPCAKSVTQRIKLAVPHKLERLAHVTNYIFAQGYLAPHLRPVVHWQNPFGKRIEEHVHVEDVLSFGEGACEERPIKLIIGAPIVAEKPKPAYGQVFGSEKKYGHGHGHGGCHCFQQYNHHCHC